jgi:hypothetical protein
MSMYPQKVKKLRKKHILLSATDEKAVCLILIQIGIRIRIRTKMSRMHNTSSETSELYILYPDIGTASHGQALHP